MNLINKIILLFRQFSFLKFIKLMRPKHWVKNLFVLAPVIFSGLLDSKVAIVDAFLAMVLFCIASSVTYVFNDYMDIESDRQHPIKSQRPLASGDVSKQAAIILICILYSVIIVLGMFNKNVFSVVVSYVLLNIAYSLYLKHQPVLDIFTIAIGFVLRVYAGAVAIQVPLSAWMFITTFSLALFLASIKRRQEILKSNAMSRNVLRFYTVPLMNRYAEMSSICALLFYSLFVISVNTEMVITIPFVIFGLYRYWFVVEGNGRGESPADVLFEDYQLQLSILLWVASCIYIIWI